MKPGKTNDDVFDYWEMIADLSRGMDADPGRGHFLWLPFRAGSQGYDYIWGVLASDFESWTDGLEAFSAAFQERFEGTPPENPCSWSRT